MYRRRLAKAFSELQKSNPLACTVSSREAARPALFMHFSLGVQLKQKQLRVTEKNLLAYLRGSEKKNKFRVTQSVLMTSIWARITITT